ncbi:MAG: hypothetical protein RR775_21295 [Massilia sp.]|uniref:hypothetical protein n=1 Tax=Massilia sp. TaxID=1882437 RepID=UPI002FC9CBE1
MARIKNVLAAAVLLAASSTALAQDVLSSIVRSTTSTKTTFAVFDVRPATTSIDALQEAVAGAFRKHYDGIKVMQQMAPHPLPVHAPRMGFYQQASALGTVSVPDCPGAAAIIASSDTTMAKYAEASILQGCVFPYRDGYRVNVYALFVQKTGGADVRVLGAMLGRAVTNAIGIGDSSRFIGETVDDIEARLKAVTADVALIELQPARPDKPLAADRAGAAPGAAAIASSEPATRRAQALPPQLAAAQAQIASLLGQQRTATGGAPVMAAPDNSASAAVQARKDLSGMGLTYFSQDQFVEAAKRGDQLACELFLRAGSVTVNTPDKRGVTALKAAATPELAAYLRSYQQ